VENAWELKLRLQVSFLSALLVSLLIPAEGQESSHQEVSRFLPGFKLLQAAMSWLYERANQLATAFSHSTQFTKDNSLFLLSTRF